MRHILSVCLPARAYPEAVRKRRRHLNCKVPDRYFTSVLDPQPKLNRIVIVTGQHQSFGNCLRNLFFGYIGAAKTDKIPLSTLLLIGKQTKPLCPLSNDLEPGSS